MSKKKVGENDIIARNPPDPLFAKYKEQLHALKVAYMNHKRAEWGLPREMANNDADPLTAVEYATLASGQYYKTISVVASKLHSDGFEGEKFDIAIEKIITRAILKAQDLLPPDPKIPSMLPTDRYLSGKFPKFDITPPDGSAGR